jgi:TonB-linked SusC/RagA family outer membrane protein
MKKHLLAGVLLLFGSMVLAQERSITGTVVSGDDGTSLPGVNVVLKGTTIGTVTDINGEYKLNVPADGGILVFSFIGLASQEIELGARSVIDVAMIADVTELSEVVVTAVGIERQTKSLGYAVQEVSGEDVASGRNTNLVNNLSGRVAGLQVTSNSGVPGGASRVNIRGATSLLNNNQPLFVVDGIPINNANDGTDNIVVNGGSNTGGTVQPNRAGDLNPEDIESITVLKGASAAALYGIRAANGVIVITTKSGKNLKGKKAEVTYSGTFMADRVLKLPDYQFRWAQGSVDFVYANGTSRSFGPEIDGVNTHVNVLGDTLVLQAFDNRDAFFETGFTAINNFSIRGGDEVRDYYLSIGRTTQDSYIPNQNYNRFSVRLNASTKISDKFRSGLNVNYIRNDGNVPFAGQDGNNPVFSLFQAPASFDLGGYPFQRPDGTQVNWRGGSFDNPFWTVNKTFVETDLNRLIGSTFLQYNVLDWVNIKATVGTDITAERRVSFKDIGTQNGGAGSIQVDNISRTEINTDIIASGNRDINEDFNVSLLVGININQRDRDIDQFAGANLVLPNFPDISNSTPGTPLVDNQRRRLFGAYFDAQIAYRNMIFLGVTGRNDWSSTLPRDERSFFYPSVNLGVAFSELLNVESDVFSFGKLRASYAQVGRDAGVHLIDPLFTLAAPADGFTTASAGISFPFNGVQGFTAVNSLGNPTLKPEKVTTYEFGTDLRFLQNRVGLDVNYFITESTDQIITVSVSGSTGFTSKVDNVGQLDSRGLEVQLNLQPVVTRNFNWDLNVNFSRIRTEVVEIIEGVDNLFLGGFAGFQARADVGERYGTLVGTAFLRDDAGNIVVDDNPNSVNYGFPVAGATEALGHVEPDWTGGIQSTMSYKNFTLDMLFETRQGGFIMNGTTELLQFYGVADETEDRTTPFVFPGVKQSDASVPNDIAIYRRANYWNQVTNINEANVYENNWFRLRSVNLTYNLPRSLFENNFIERASLTLTGRNLFLISSVPDIDPESSAFGTGNAQGFHRFDLPTTRSFGGSVSITF